MPFEIKKSCALLGLFLGLMSVSLAQNDTPTAQVERASAEFVRAVKAGDLRMLEKLQSPAMVYVAANDRRMTREQVFAALEGDFGKWSLHNTVIEACQIFGDTAVTTGTEEVRSESGAGAGSITPRRFTNVWQRSERGWVMISRTVAVISSQTPTMPKTNS